MPAALHYEPADPFAVRISFPATASLDGADVEWTFGRELLAAGLRGPAGSGDVRLWPCGAGRTMLELHTEEGMAMVQLDSHELLRFLSRSFAVVASGREAEQLDLDGDLAALLDER